MMPIPARRASCGVRRWTGFPSRRISPESAWYAPARIFMSVLFPAPFSPMKACTSPGQMLRFTFLRTRTPGKLLLIWRTSRIGRSLLLRPAFVLVDIFFGDQVYRDQGEFLSRLLTIHNIVTDIDRFPRHRVRILGRTSRDQAIFIFERRHYVWCSIDPDTKEVFSLCLLGGQIATDSRRIVNREYGIDFWKSG